MEKNFVLELQDDFEYYCLKNALCHYLYFSSCFECLEGEYVLCRSLLERLSAGYLEYLKSTENFFVLNLQDDNHWQCLKTALCSFLNFCFFFESLNDEYLTCRSCLNRLGVDNV